MRRARLCLVALLAGPALLSAQTEHVEADPIACWWRTGAGSIRVGEPFTVILTCSLLETDAVRVLADDSRLEPSVLRLPPFDVTGGSRAKDVITAGRRFFQYQYRLRLIGEEVFGRDVSLPALQLTYRIESRLAPGASDAAAESTQGRDLTYALPPLAVRVQSLVPDAATDIRETPVATFDQTADRAFRGTALRVAAGILFLLGGLTAGIAVARLARRRAAEAAPGRVLSDRVILDRVRDELSAVREERREAGWTSPLAGRALAAMRIAAAHASGRSVSQRRALADAPASDGELAVNGRPHGAALISGSVTAGGMSSDGAAHEELREGLARFTAARYGRDARLDASMLDESLDQTIQIVDRLAAGRRSPPIGRRLARLRGRS